MSFTTKELANDADRIAVDIIIPVHNAASTVRESVESAFNQVIPSHLQTFYMKFSLTVTICCYDDGSDDNSWDILLQLQSEFQTKETSNRQRRLSNDQNLSFKEISQDSRCGTHSLVDYQSDKIPVALLIGRSEDGLSRGAGFARNRAASMMINTKSSESIFIESQTPKDEESLTDDFTSTSFC